MTSDNRGDGVIQWNSSDRHWTFEFGSWHTNRDPAVGSRRNRDRSIVTNLFHQGSIGCGFRLSEYWWKKEYARFKIIILTIIAQIMNLINEQSHCYHYHGGRTGRSVVSWSRAFVADNETKMIKHKNMRTRNLEREKITWVDSHLSRVTSRKMVLFLTLKSSTHLSRLFWRKSNQHTLKSTST